MKTIHKHELLGGPICLKAGFQVLTVQMHGEKVMLWVLCDPEAPLVMTNFYLAGTGWEMNDNIMDKKYIATVQDGRGFVWHVFQGETE